MPIKKNTKATSAAIQQGLTVKTAPVKATKATAAKIASNRVTKTVTVTAPKTVAKKTAAKVVKSVGSAKTAPAKATPAQIPGAGRLLWTADSDRASAQRSLVRHVNKFNKMASYQTLAVTGAQSYWAEATKDVRKTGYKGLKAGTWYLALDIVLNGKEVTIVFDSEGQQAFYTPTDNADNYGLKFWD